AGGEEALDRDRPPVLAVAAANVEQPAPARGPGLCRGQTVDEGGLAGRGEAQPRLELSQRGKRDDLGVPTRLGRLGTDLVRQAESDHVLAVRPVLVPRRTVAGRLQGAVTIDGELAVVRLAVAAQDLAPAAVPFRRPAEHPPLLGVFPALLEG